MLEVKTTDAYRISLDTIARYRSKLAGSNEIGPSSSILIVVGREDTGELEAQVRGSRHAWDIRLISADALMKLVQIKENAEGVETGLKIRSLLAPMEYTRLDKMIDVMFTAAKDVEAAANATDAELEAETDGEQQSHDEKEQATRAWQFTEPGMLQEKREQIVSAVGRRVGTTLIKKSRALFWDTMHERRLACYLSKRYPRKGAPPYWYAYHPQWHEFLKEGGEGFLALGCMDLDFAFAIPVVNFEPILGALNTTTKEDGKAYWHIHVVEQSPDRYSLLMPKRSTGLDLNTYRIAI